MILIDPYLSSTHEEATVGFYFGRILTRLGVDHFPSFRLMFDFIPRKFAACSPSRYNHREAPYPRTKHDQDAG